MIGKVIKKSASLFVVEDNNNVQYNTAAFKKNKMDNKIIVGDNVEFNSNANTYVIEKVLERKNYIIRPHIANIDVLIVVQSVFEPDLNVFQLNKYLAFYEYQNINSVIICFTKYDLLNEQQKNEINEIIDAYKKDNYICLINNNEQDVNKIISLFDNKQVVCFAGESGVGKSTLINKIIPNSTILTNEISKKLNRGKHTTTTNSLIKFKNGYVVDTPGFGSVELDVSNEELAKCFNDFRELSKHCKFSNCLHNNEKDCAIKKAVEEKKIWHKRYESYLKMLNNNKYKIKYKK